MSTKHLLKEIENDISIYQSNNWEQAYIAAENIMIFIDQKIQLNPCLNRLEAAQLIITVHAAWVSGEVKVGL